MAKLSRLHTHVYIHYKSAVQRSTLEKCLNFEDISVPESSEKTRDYIFKEGSINQSESGEMPIERQGARKENIYQKLIDLVEEGKSNTEIMKEIPYFSTKLDKVEIIRQTLRAEQYEETIRDVKVVYIFGKTGTGKTSGILKHYKYKNVYRVTNYKNPFDSYKGQDVLVFDEFRSSLKMQEMLNYLDIHPFDMPCRYGDKVPCFTKVFIISNIELEDQYINIQQEEPETWKAFLRRIHIVREYIGVGEFEEYTTDEYFTQKDSAVYSKPSLIISRSTIKKKSQPEKKPLPKNPLQPEAMQLVEKKKPIPIKKVALEESPQPEMAQPVKKKKTLPTKKVVPEESLQLEVAQPVKKKKPLPKRKATHIQSSELYMSQMHI